MVKTFKADKDGYVKFTEKELKDLLDEVYNEGCNNGKMITWTSPFYYSYTYATPKTNLTSNANTAINTESNDTRLNTTITAVNTNTAVSTKTIVDNFENEINNTQETAKKKTVDWIY